MTRAAERRVTRARVALLCLTEQERRMLFREVGMCSCAEIVRVAVQNPIVGVGALAGGVLAAIFSAKRSAMVPGGTIVGADEMRKLLGEKGEKKA